MTFIAATGLSCLLIPALYFVLLMADAKKLERRLRRAPEHGQEALESQGLLISLDYTAWKPVPFSTEEDSGDEPEVRFFPHDAASLRAAKGFGQVAIPDTDGLP